MRRVLLIYRDLGRVPAYRDALLAAGLEPDIVEAGSAFSLDHHHLDHHHLDHHHLDHHHGVLLMGGADVDPALYGEARQVETDAPDPELDSAELSVLEDALQRDMPVLAICRGLQLLNVHHGGTLTQHLIPPERHRVANGDRSLPVHPVAIESGTLLSEIANEPTWQVNSRHHQSVKKLGAGLRIAATHPGDGVIEAVERPDRSFVLAVQWHPEDQIRRDPSQLDLFHRFAKATQSTR